MNPDIPLTIADEIQLGWAVQENLFALFRAMADLHGGEFVENEHNCYHLTFPTNPMYKGVWRTSMDSDEVEAGIDETLAWFRARHAPFAFWWTGPGTSPDDLGRRLAARGLLSMEVPTEALSPGMRSAEVGAPGMVADLFQMDESVLDRTPERFTIEQVDREASLLEFKQVLVEGYEIPERMAHGWVESGLGFGFDRLPWSLFLGRLNGEPVASNILYRGAGVVGVYGVATVPAARRKGIGRPLRLSPCSKPVTPDIVILCCSPLRWVCLSTSGSASAPRMSESTASSGETRECKSW